MRIFGIDPGIARTGWAVVEKNKNGVEAVNFGCFETKPNLDTTERLLRLHAEILRLFDMHEPEALAIEDIFFNTNAKTAISVGQARGVIILSGAEKKIPVFTYTPLQVKIAITGYGRAEKNQISNMVKSILHLEEIPKPDDTADALAIALTHAFSNTRLKVR